jgi:hypothetical protein
MTKEEMSTLLRSVGVNENTVTGMENAYEIGVEQERARVANILIYWGDHRKSIEGDLIDILQDVQRGAEYP